MRPRTTTSMPRSIKTSSGIVLTIIIASSRRSWPIHLPPSTTSRKISASSQKEHNPTQSSPSPALRTTTNPAWSIKGAALYIRKTSRRWVDWIRNCPSRSWLTLALCARAKALRTTLARTIAREKGPWIARSESSFRIWFSKLIQPIWNQASRHQTRSPLTARKSKNKLRIRSMIW